VPFRNDESRATAICKAALIALVLEGQ
jgi:hypothetical protein